MNKALIRLKNTTLSPLFIGIAFFLILQFQIYNYGFNYRDEGYLLNNAQRINNGEMPYVDFSMALTPGAFYIQALIMKIFGNYIITDRILYILCVIFVLALSSRLFKFTKHLNYIFLSFLALTYVGWGSFASYNMYSLVFVLIALFLLNKLRDDNKKHGYALLIGLANSLVFFIKQTYGGIFFFSLLLIIIFFTERKYLFKNILFYFAGSSVLPIIILSTLYLSGILDKVIYNVFYFALAVKNDRMPFILTSILFIPFFAFVFNFIKKFSAKRLILSVILLLVFLIIYILISPSRVNYIYGFYKDYLIYYFFIFFTLPIILINLFFKSKNKNNRWTVVIAICAFSLFIAQAFSGRDYAVVVVAAPLYLPLFLISLITVCRKFKLNLNNDMAAIMLLIVLIFPSITYLFKTYGGLYGIFYKKETYVNMNIQEAKYIKIPINQKKDLEQVIDYVKNTTALNSKLLCIPYCSFLNYLTERKNASYFSFFYKFNKNDQGEVIDDLKRNDGSTIAIQRLNVIEKEANYEDKNLNLLKTFIFKKYKLVKTTENFYIYKK